MRILTMAWRNVQRNRRRSIITLTSIVIGLAAVNLFQGYMFDTMNGLRKGAIYGEGLGHLVIYKQGALTRGRINEDAYLLSGDELTRIREAVADLPEVDFVAPRVAITGLISDGNHSLVFLGTGIDPGDADRFRKDFVGVGTGDPVGVAHPDGLEIGIGLADALHLPPGETAVLFGTTAKGRLNAVEARVQRTIDTGNHELNDRMVIGPLSLFRTLYRIDGASFLSVVLKGDADPVTLRGTLAERFRRAGLALDVYTWEERSGFYSRVVELYGMIFGFLFLVVLIVAIMSVLNTMTMSVLERVREIALLRAIGMPRRSIYGLFMAEGLVLGLLGAVSGAVASIGCAALINALHLTYIPPTLSQAVPLNIQIEPGIVLANGLIVALLAGAVVWFPARLGARKDIVEGLAHA